MKANDVIEITRQVIETLEKFDKRPFIPVGVSNRHIHISQEDCEVLFGEGYKLTPTKPLQPNQYACAETVTIIGNKGKIDNVRILGPVRPETQCEISATDGFKLGIKVPVHMSGNIDNTPSFTIVGPKGTIKKREGIIIALVHIHMPPSFAEKFNLRQGQSVSVKFSGIRAVTFNNVIIRISSEFDLEMHMDTDEANAGQISTGDYGEIIV